MKTARKPKPLESAVQKECLARFARLGVPVWRRNVAAMSGEYKGKKRFIRSGTKGMADAFFVLPSTCMRPGVHGEFETKREGNKPTFDQIVWLRETNKDTGASFWADSPDTVEAVVRALMYGGRIVYAGGTCSYPNPVKGCKGRVDGPSWDYDVVMN